MIKISVISEEDKTCEITETNFKNIDELIIPDEIKGYKVIRFSTGAFEKDYVKKLKSVHLPKYLTQISEYAFIQGDNLAYINIPDAVREIGTSAFNLCSKLHIDSLPENIEKIDLSALPPQILDDAEEEDGLLYYKNLLLGNRLDSNHKKIKIREGTTLIAARALSSTSITTVHLPKSLKYICNSAFANCYELEEIIFSGKLERVDSYAFSQTKIEKDRLTNSGAFYLGNTLVAVSDNVTHFEMKPGIDKIAEYAFKISSVQSAVIAEGVTNLPEGVFHSCKTLKEVRLPSTLRSIGPWCFAFCERLNKINLPKSLETIEECAFEMCTSLKEVSFSNGITTIQNNAFYQCVNLPRITLPETVANIGKNAFMLCKKLNTVDVYDNTRFEKDVFSEDCISLKHLLLHENGNLTHYQVDQYNINNFLNVKKK